MSTHDLSLEPEPLHGVAARLDDAADELGALAGSTPVSGDWGAAGAVLPLLLAAVGEASALVCDEAALLSAGTLASTALMVRADAVVVVDVLRLGASG